MIYSYDERKIGSYFGEDLYEKSFNITAEAYNSEDNAYVIDLGETADKIINCDGFIYSANENDIPYKLKLPLNTEPKLTLAVDRKTDTICTKIYDRATVESETYNAAVYIFVDATDYISSTGIIKVQYTKLPAE